MFLLNVSQLVLGHYDILTLIFLSTLECLTFSVEKGVVPKCSMVPSTVWQIFTLLKKKWIVISKTDIP